MHNVNARENDGLGVRFSLKRDKEILGKEFESVSGFLSSRVYQKKIIAIDFLVHGCQVAFDFIPNDLDDSEYLLYCFSRNQPEKIKEILDYEKKDGKLFIGCFSVGDKKISDNIKNIIKTIGSEVFLEAKGENEGGGFDSKVLAYPKKEKNRLKKSKVIIPRDRSGELFNIRNVVEEDICIGCGACAIATNGSINMDVSEKGIYKASLKDISSLNQEMFFKADSVCPFSDSASDESELDVPSEKSISLPYDSSLGRYGAIFAGRQSDDSHLIGSSSGGLTSWLIKQLLIQDKVDGIIHVGKSGNDSELFEYRVSYSIKEIDSNRKSAYYSTTLSNALQSLEPNKKYAIVGVPCFIKSARLLAKEDKILKSSLKYYVGLVCGHLKSSFFAESNAWQVGVQPQEIDYVDFRVKNPKKKANQYEFIAKSKSEGDVHSKQTSKLMGGNWGFGFFQPNACNFCDDVFAETADVVFGDAWLPEFKNDWRGTNVVVTRNDELVEIFQNGIDNKQLNLKNISLKDAVKSQAGGLRHRRAGLQARLYDDINNGANVPQKRVKPSIESIPDWRLNLIRQRRSMSMLSLDAFLASKKSNNLGEFLQTMNNQISLYKYLDSHRYPPVKKKHYYDIALFGWHHQANLGGVLTFFALHQLLKKNDFSVVVIWRPSRSKITSGNKPNYDVLSKYYKYSKFRTPEDLHELRNYCDKLVLASDQLWAGKWIPFNPEYEFLGCGDGSVTKISVATSFGGDGSSLPFDKDKAPIVKHLLHKMDHVSVREPSGVDILADEGVAATQILDPVFLCGHEVYEELIEQATLKLESDSYLMGYILDAQAPVVNFANKEVAGKIGVKDAFFMTTMANSNNQDAKLASWNELEDVDFFAHVNVADFVKAISGAEFLYTDSFHGACMAVIFHKPFICSPKSSRGHSRFALFEQLGLGNRIVSRDNLDSSVANEPIDWDEVDKRLEKMLDNSFKWLSNAFGKKMNR